MPFGLSSATIGAIAGPVLGAATSAALGPSSTASGGGSGLYTPTGLSSADQSWQQVLQQMQNYYGANSGTINSGANSAYQGLINANNQYGGGYQNAANAAGSQYSALGNTLGGLSTQDAATQQALLNAGQQTYQASQTGNTPQYQLNLNNMMQQTGATNSMYGLGSSAAGAGVQNQALNNFNIDWNTQQLQNQIAGLGAYTNAANSAGNYGTAAANLGQQGAADTLAGGQVPYSTAQSIANAPNSALSSMSGILNSGVYQPGSGIQSSIIPYLNYGQGATSNAYNAASTSAGALGSAVSSGITGLGNATQNMGSLSSLFGPTSATGTSTSPYYSGGGNTYGFTS